MTNRDNGTEKATAAEVGDNPTGLARFNGSKGFGGCKITVTQEWLHTVFHRGASCLDTGIIRGTKNPQD